MHNTSKFLLFYAFNEKMLQKIWKLLKIAVSLHRKKEKLLYKTQKYTLI